MIVVTAVLGAGTFDLSVRGHETVAAGDAGQVCAAVSAVSQTCILGLEQIALAHPKHIRIDIKEIQ